MKITVQGDKQVFATDIIGMDKLVIGRHDPDSGTSPAIDLDPYRAQEHGVSRRHASLLCRQNTVQIVDLGTPNGTYVNEVRLYPSHPQRLRDGDMVRVGFLTLHIKLEHASATNSLN